MRNVTANVQLNQELRTAQKRSYPFVLSSHTMACMRQCTRPPLCVSIHEQATPWRWEQLPQEHDVIRYKAFSLCVSMLLQWLPWEHDVVPVILYQISVSVFVRGWNELCGDALLSTTKSVSVNLLLVVVVVFSRTFPKRCWGGYKSRLWFLDNLRKLLLVMRFLQMCPIHKRWVKLQLYSRC